MSMARTDFFLIPLVILFTLPASALGSDGIQWDSQFQAALDKAKQENKPVFIAINMDGEPVCEKLVKNHYRDKEIIKLSQEMVSLFASRYYHKDQGKSCPRAGHIPCAYHQEVEKRMREFLPEIQNAGGDVIAPQHVFLGPDGKVLLSIPYFITVGQLEWCMVEAIRKVDPAFTWELRSSAKAPKLLFYEKLSNPDNVEGVMGRRPARLAEPLTKEELEEVKERVQSSGRWGLYQSVKEYFPSLIVTDSGKAMDLVATLLTHRTMINRGQTGRVLHEIGRTSPGDYWEVVAPYVSHEKVLIRMEAIVALEQLAEPRSLKTLQRQRSAEKEDRVKANLMRAIASTGRGNRTAESLVLKAAAKDKTEEVRLHALVALTYVENREKVNEVLAEALLDPSKSVRAAAAYAAAVRRDRELMEPLRIAVEGEQDPTCKTHLRGAMAVLEGGTLQGVQPILTVYLGDTILRDRE
jgi:hypothetical protein